MLTPITDVSNGWDSTRDMITEGIKIQADPKLTHLTLTTFDWALLDLAVKDLRNFKILSKTFCGDKYITLPYVAWVSICSKTN